MKKQLLKAGFLGLTLMLATSAPAKLLTVKHGAGQTTQVGITKINRIHFDNGVMQIEHSEGTHQIAISDIDQMRFDLETTSVDNISETLDDLTISVASGFVTVSAAAETAIKLNVYDLRGYNVAAADGFGSVSIDLSTLASGVYIVKANDKTIKFIR